MFSGTFIYTAPEYSHTWGNDLEKITYKKWVDEQLFPGSYRDQVLKEKRESYHTALSRLLALTIILCLMKLIMSLTYY